MLTPELTRAAKRLGLNDLLALILLDHLLGAKADKVEVVVDAGLL
jgi:hypothetical protein